ncbi:hypothetical protein CJ179_45500 [Rhodococcus sp. ACS1]|jgi:hypothetical protein|uniref:Uncharacterized protein n=1 Tax=Rhodococcus jostii (strain RHA1) TaxID=101510 RepID=Q0SG49_RHOJR|nr:MULTISPECIES: hypothetical protein [Rhodococcus]ABG93487.1 conserved hypothetical protein [Rhodococcus jostii RHA1]PBC36305.1 hypothetical protein CJ179_45500 [Rhodococcus sp. ACS1]
MGVGETRGRDLTVDELRLRRVTSDAETSLVTLGKAHPEVAVALARMVQAVADEAARTPRFAKALGEALTAGGIQAPPASPKPAAARNTTTRSKGVLDPFSVFEVSGEAGLRARLKTLNAEQLKDIVTEHSMNYDKAAMRWKTPPRLIDRIVERVQARATKGDVLR